MTVDGKIHENEGVTLAHRRKNEAVTAISVAGSHRIGGMKRPAKEETQGKNERKRLRLGDHTPMTEEEVNRKRKPALGGLIHETEQKANMRAGGVSPPGKTSVLLRLIKEDMTIKGLTLELAEQRTLKNVDEVLPGKDEEVSLSTTKERIHDTAEEQAHGRGEE